MVFPGISQYLQIMTVMSSRSNFLLFPASFLTPWQGPSLLCELPTVLTFSQPWRNIHAVLLHPRPASEAVHNLCNHTGSLVRFNALLLLSWDHNNVWTRGSAFLLCIGNADYVAGTVQRIVSGVRKPATIKCKQSGISTQEPCLIWLAKGPFADMPELYFLFLLGRFCINRLFCLFFFF